MAKKGKGHRQLMLLVCSDCNNRNYISEKNKLNTAEKLEVAKYCKTCRKRTPHKEQTRLK